MQNTCEHRKFILYRTRAPFSIKYITLHSINRVPRSISVLTLVLHTHSINALTRHQATRARRRQNIFWRNMPMQNKRAAPDKVKKKTCVAVCCSVLQCVAVCSNVSQCADNVTELCRRGPHVPRSTKFRFAKFSSIPRFVHKMSTELTFQKFSFYDVGKQKRRTGQNRHS